ncbi:phage tail tape measure protein, TP901 family, core region [Paenibacillus uliginis N3/975]|uniref:Phage tail tape measure protein, TP901 family, core region n=1 Tax=Paenibacillus uliginis N3/975 TaxID=1313296 RepID=A0A1X7HQM2_9BACL|nr:phage tail tape measure protein [Paenibacillus uliginis]SMF91206.1 phage tail tape measure protein, TP901 family, core region [Paenibacillus uliginis N3/975]
MSFELLGRIKIKDDGASKTLRDVEKMTERAKKATKLYTDTNDQLARAQAHVSRSAGSVAHEIKGVGRASKNATQAMGKLGNKAKSVFSSIAGGIGRSALYGGIAAIGTAGYVGYKSLSKAMDFEAQMSSVQALTGATDKQMAQMQTLALEMGADTKYNALEAAQAIEELLKAGLSPATVQAGALEAALNLATAGELDLAAAAEIMSTALNAFQEDGMTAAQAADILAGTANASATGVEELRYSLSMTSAVAAGLGMNFEDTNIALGLFANRGLKGSDAGTSLKTMLQTLQPVTKDQIALFEALGLVTADGSNQFFDAAGNIKSLDDIAGTLRKSMAKLTNQERQHALKLMFGTDAVRAATILFKEGAEGVEQFREEMSKVTALDVARKKMDNAAGAVEQFSGAMETLQIAGMMPVLPIVKDLANAAADFVEKYTPQIVAGVQSMVDKAKNYVKTKFIDNPEFQKLPDIPSKIVFIFEDVMQAFREWWGSAGQGYFQSIVSEITNFLVVGLKALVPEITAIGLDIGTGIANGVIDGLKQNLVPDAIKSVIPGANDDQSKRLKEFRTELDNLAPGESYIKGQTYMGAPVQGTSKYRGHSGGLDNVPYNGYTARLHAGETVLPREEAKRYRGEGGVSGGGKSAPTINITGPIHINNGMDYDNFVRRLAHDLAM